MMEFDNGVQYEVIHISLERRIGRVILLGGDPDPVRVAEDLYVVLECRYADNQAVSRKRVHVGTAHQTRGYLQRVYLDQIGRLADAQITMARKTVDADFAGVMTAGLVPVCLPQLAIGPGDAPGTWTVMDLGTGEAIAENVGDVDAAISGHMALADAIYEAVSDVERERGAVKWRQRLDEIIDSVRDISARQAAVMIGHGPSINGKTIYWSLPETPPAVADLIALADEILRESARIADDLGQCLLLVGTISDGTGRADEIGMQLIRELARQKDTGIGGFVRHKRLARDCRKFMRLWTQYERKGPDEKSRKANHQYFWGMVGKMVRGEAAITRTKGEVQYIVR